MEVRIEPTFRAEICLAGDFGIIQQACREFCFRVGCCVTVTPCSYIYTGGEEAGALVRLINYPRFPSTPEELYAKAEMLAMELMQAACQHSVLILDDLTTKWISMRDESKVAK